MSLVNLAHVVRQETDGGRELVRLQLAIARGEKIPVPGRRQGQRGRGEAQFQRPNIDQRQSAIAWLADRAFGKSKEIIELTGEATPSQRLEYLRRLSDDDRHVLREILQRALMPHASGSANDERNGRVDGDPALHEDDREVLLPDNGTPAVVPLDDVAAADRDADPPPTSSP
jgi:hypothetical protein